MIKKMKMGRSKQICSICSNTYQKGISYKKRLIFLKYIDEIIKKLPCKHIFHENCIKPWLQISQLCPNCRFDVGEFFKLNSKKKTETKKEI